MEKQIILLFLVSMVFVNFTKKLEGLFSKVHLIFAIFFLIFLCTGLDYYIMTIDKLLLVSIVLTLMQVYFSFHYKGIKSFRLISLYSLVFLVFCYSDSILNYALALFLMSIIKCFMLGNKPSMNKVTITSYFKSILFISTLQIFISCLLLAIQKKYFIFPGLNANSFNELVMILKYCSVILYLSILGLFIYEVEILKQVRSDDYTEINYIMIFEKLIVAILILKLLAYREMSILLQEHGLLEIIPLYVLAAIICILGVLSLNKIKTQISLYNLQVCSLLNIIFVTTAIGPDHYDSFLYLFFVQQFIFIVIDKIACTRQYKDASYFVLLVLFLLIPIIQEIYFISLLSNKLDSASLILGTVLLFLFIILSIYHFFSSIDELTNNRSIQMADL